MGERQVDIGLLIELIQQEPHIYDKSNKFFKDDMVKQGTYQKVGRILNITTEQCRKIWKNLRDRYVREKRKMRVTHSGQECDEDYALWPYTKPLSFLEPYIRPRTTYTATKAVTSCATSCATIAAPSSPPIATHFMMETGDDGILVEIDNDVLQEPDELQELEESPEPEASQEPEESQVTARYSRPTSSTLTAVGETPNKRVRRNSNKVANELVDAARQIVAQIKPARNSTDSFFGQYVAERLQELSPDQRSAKRRAIVLLLEGE